MDEYQGMSGDDRIIAEAKDRFRHAEEWEATFRTNYAYDMKFANGDSHNKYQWDAGVARSRESENRPVLTINKTMQHCLQIINDQRQNPSQIEIRPVGGGASYDAAAVLEGICRHIESISQAQQAYNNACYHQVVGGCGYWRITTDYIEPDSFLQEIYIKRISDPMSVYMDFNIQEADGSDAEWAFIYKNMPVDEFERSYPNEDRLTSSPLGYGSADDWINRDTVRLAEYFRKSYKKDTLYLLPDGTTVLASDARAKDMDAVVKMEAVNSRKVQIPQVEWFLIGGGEVLDRKIWPGRYIPVVRVIGTETVIDNVMDRFGHTRALVDPQRIYNFWSSSTVEFVSYQTKSPFIAAIESIAGFERNWERANIDTKAYLPYNAMDENGQKLERPERAPVPVMAQAYLEGLKIAAGEMMLVSGQYEASMGMKSNEVSGKAVDARERQGDNATYHFIDRFASAIRYTGRILVDLIPHIYDSSRVVRIMAQNGDESSVQIDPNANVAHQPLQKVDAHDYNPDAIQAIFNPGIGTYEVEADIGPAFATRRQETFAAISTMLSENASLTPIVGDLLFRAADFPMSQEIANRLHNLVPKQALGEGPDPQLVQAQQLLAQQHQALQKMEGDLAQAQIKLVGVQQDARIKEYEAETNRMKAVGGIDPEAMRPIVRQLVSEALGTPINPIIHAHAQEAAALPQPPEPDESNGT